jgi:hypothetical protein
VSTLFLFVLLGGEGRDIHSKTFISPLESTFNDEKL